MHQKDQNCVETQVFDTLMIAAVYTPCAYRTSFKKYYYKKNTTLKKGAVNGRDEFTSSKKKGKKHRKDRKPLESRTVLK